MAYRKPISKEEIDGLRSEISALTQGFDALADHLVVTDADANIIYANKAAEAHTGYSFSEMIGKTPGDLWGGRMPKEFYENMWQVIKTFKKPYTAEVENKNKDGNMYWQELRIYPIMDEHGAVRFFIAIEPDITIRKTREAHYSQYVEELERLMKYMEAREIKIKELTEEVAELKKRLGEGAAS